MQFQKLNFLKIKLNLTASRKQNRPLLLRIYDIV